MFFLFFPFFCVHGLLFWPKSIFLIFIIFRPQMNGETALSFYILGGRDSIFLILIRVPPEMKGETTFSEQ